MEGFICSLGWDSEASTRADLSVIGGLEVGVASGFCSFSCGNLAEAAASVTFGVGSVFLSSRLVLGVWTSFSMAVARDFGPSELP